MLVLSRQLGQAIVIDDQIVVTLLRYTDEYAEVSLSTVRGVGLGSEELSRGQSTLLPHNVWAILIRSEPTRIRLGLEYPRDVRIDRKEHWNEPGGTERIDRRFPSP